MLVLAQKGDDIIGCAITSNPHSDGVPIREYKQGSLAFESKAKYWQVHTFIKDLAIKKVATLTQKNQSTVVKRINELIKV